MKWSIKIFEFAGIGVFVHWTFLILLGWIVFIHFAAGESAAMALVGVGFILALFACVVLHEFGHALTARRFGIETRDITLLPIGGVARLTRMPDDPWQEFLVAVAGPAVNVVIAIVLFGALVVFGHLSDMYQFEIVGGSFLAKLMWVNVILVVFNMIPAFPMDGGRVLRALLATQMSHLRATHIAASVGQSIAILFGLAGLLSGNWVLLFIALFVYLGAQGEAQSVEMRSIFQSVPVRAAMATEFHTLRPTDSLEFASQQLLAGHQQDFPVVDEEKIVGLLRRSDLLKALGESSGEQLVGDAMTHECPIVSTFDPLDRAVELMHDKDCSTLPVTFGGILVGVLTSENIGEWAMIQSARRERGQTSTVRKRMSAESPAPRAGNVGTPV